jgi:hypothetical protein
VYFSIAAEISREYGYTNNMNGYLGTTQQYKVKALSRRFEVGDRGQERRESVEFFFYARWVAVIARNSLVRAVMRCRCTKGDVGNGSRLESRKLHGEPLRLSIKIGLLRR